MDFRTVASDGSIESWWRVAPSYDYAEDCQTGREYADQFVHAWHEGQVQTGLRFIIAAFPRKMSGVEVGFLQRISERLV